MSIPVIRDIEIDDTLKGVPWGTKPFLLRDVARRGWNVLAGDLPLPIAVIKKSALETNSAWMRAFLKDTGALLAPHGKTTMCPQLFHRQLDDGAWGITLASSAQMQVARRFGVSRILLANQLVGQSAIDFIFGELKNDPDFDFYCLVDSVEGVDELATAAKNANIGRPLQVLVEGGIAGRRTGSRNLEQALLVARAASNARPYLALRGVEGFEGMISAPTEHETAASITRFLTFLGQIAQSCETENLFAPGPVILSAGGSAFYDLVVKIFGDLHLEAKTEVIIRSGCYLTHDAIMYHDFIDQMRRREPGSRRWGTPPRAALEVWGLVQSRPEPGRVIVNIGKRDASYDAGLPKPFAWARSGEKTAPQSMPSGHVTVEMNDQHLFMDVPANSPLGLGDRVGFGISHPCLTFDKWQFIPVVDDQYTVVSALRTFF
ncbi:MAG: amino acid deaminase [Alphaproteobacteria bacterium]|nr:amino acid deaminase [Alphaproteobacteria bacterium]